MNAQNMHADKGKISLPRHLVIKEAQISPISKPCKLGYI